MTSNASVEKDRAPPKPGPKRKPPTPRSAFWLRFGAGHFLAYPPAFAAAFAGVPLTMLIRERAVLTAPNEDVAQRLVLEVCVAAAAIVYLLVHLYALPWSLAAAAAVRGEPNADVRRNRGWKFFLSALLITSFVSVAGALVGWVWLLA